MCVCKLDETCSIWMIRIGPLRLSSFWKWEGGRFGAVRACSLDSRQVNGVREGRSWDVGEQREHRSGRGCMAGQPGGAGKVSLSP